MNDQLLNQAERELAVKGILQKLQQKITSLQVNRSCLYTNGEGNTFLQIKLKITDAARQVKQLAFFVYKAENGEIVRRKGKNATTSSTRKITDALLDLLMETK